MSAKTSPQIAGAGALIALFGPAKAHGLVGNRAANASEIRALIEGSARNDRMNAIHAEYLRRGGRTKR